ncbi:MAG TPA: prephenate dehydrogenase/arogenate dehydrogenase family protein [Blastocatellia bacterium]|nr:prephenate dehydrogenase/arogenate dehydrogenase family protein [Blastocatellia bacterium]
MPQKINSSTITSRFPRICIVGVGLLGGSFAAALRARGYRGQLSGYDVRPLEPLISRGLIDNEEQSFDRNETCNADLIYLAAPINKIIEFLKTKGHLFKPGAIVTDTGSTKRAIVSAAEHVIKNATFVGGHPMAGSEHTGADYADAQLFSGATYILTPSATEQLSDLETLSRFLDAHPVILSPEDHDRMVALISQVPQLLSTALAANVGSESDHQILFNLAGNGYRDMTRLAASQWSVWGDICETNADNIAAGLEKLIASLTHLRTALSSGDGKTVSECFQQANESATLFRQTKIKPFSKQANFTTENTESTEHGN